MSLVDAATATGVEWKSFLSYELGFRGMPGNKLYKSVTSASKSPDKDMFFFCCLNLELEKCPWPYRLLAHKRKSAPKKGALV